MTIVRCVAGLAAILSAMLVQATTVGAWVYPVPVSLALLVVVAVAVLSGPSTGIALGFGAGLLADLTSRHPVGVLALTWLAAGVAAGIVGGVVMEPGPVGAQRGRRTMRSAKGTRRAASVIAAGTSRWRAQALLTAAVATGATAVAITLTAALGHEVRSLPAALVLLIPAGLIDAILAVPVLVVARFMLASAALRPITPARLGVDAPAATLPMDLHSDGAVGIR